MILSFASAGRLRTVATRHQTTYCKVPRIASRLRGCLERCFLIESRPCSGIRTIGGSMGARSFLFIGPRLSHALRSWRASGETTPADWDWASYSSSAPTPLIYVLHQSDLTPLSKGLLTRTDNFIQTVLPVR